MLIYYTVYKITNKINGKIYIGIHKTTDLEDGYMGSGNLIKRAISKHGVENFKKEYIEIFDNKEKMCQLEKELVDEKFVKSLNTYNMAVGGMGGVGGNLPNYEKLKEYLKNQSVNNRLSYLENPKHCSECSNIIPFDKRINIYCCSSCAAKSNNKKGLIGKKQSQPTSKKIKVVKKSKREIYNENKKICLTCNNEIPYEKRVNIFCCRSCKATYTNKYRYLKIGE